MPLLNIATYHFKATHNDGLVLYHVARLCVEEVYGGYMAWEIPEGPTGMTCDTPDQAVKAYLNYCCSGVISDVRMLDQYEAECIAEGLRSGIEGAIAAETRIPDATETTTEGPPIILTPTWAGMLRYILFGLENGTEEGRKTARVELARMARLADKYAAMCTALGGGGRHIPGNTGLHREPDPGP